MAAVLTVHISRSQLNGAIVGSLVMAGACAYWVVHAREHLLTPVLCTIVCASAVALLVVLRILSPSVITVFRDKIVFRHPLLWKIEEEIPLANILSAHSCWKNALSPEDAPSLVLEVSGMTKWNRRLFANVRMDRRARYGLPSSGLLLEYQCSGCTPPPYYVAEKINELLGAKRPSSWETSKYQPER